MNEQEIIELLKEIRTRLLFDLDSEGEPNSSIVDLMAMWDKVNKAIQLTEV